MKLTGEFALRAGLSVAAGMAVTIGAYPSAERNHDDPDSPGVSRRVYAESLVAGLAVEAITFVAITQMSEQVALRNRRPAPQPNRQSRTEAVPATRRSRRRGGEGQYQLRRSETQPIISKLATWVVGPEVTIDMAIDDESNQPKLDAAVRALKLNTFEERYPDPDCGEL